MLPTTPVSNGTARNSSHVSPSLEQLLPAGGRELPAVVKQVATGNADGKVFRIQVEANNRLLELISRAPLNTGDRITLSRSPAGELLLSLLAPTRPNTAASAGSGRPALLLQASTAQVQQLQQSLPLNTPRPAQVISSTPVSSSAAPVPTNTLVPQSMRPSAPNSIQNPVQTQTQTQTQTTVSPNSKPVTPANGNQTTDNKASGSPAAARPETTAPMQTAKVQVYRAQLQQMTQITPSAPQLATPATVAMPAATAQGMLSAQPSASVQPGPLPNTRSAPAAMPASSPAPRTLPPTTASHPSTSTPSEGASPARVSHSGNTLLQTLGQQQVRQAQPHLVQLRMDTQQLQLISPRPLQAGQQVILTRTSSDQVQLNSPPPVETVAQRPASQVALQNALREALPQQIPFGDALNQLVQLSQTPAARNNSAINQLVQSMLSLFSVTPGSPDAEHSIKRNLQQGGLMTESQLARSAPGDKPAADIKQHLGQLLKAAEQLPNEARQQMHRLVDALQARTTTQQVNSLQGWREQPDGTQERVYRLDLPIRQAEQHETAELTIHEYRQSRPDDEPLTSWSVALHFDLQHQGSVDARLSLQEGWRLQLQFWAESAATVQRIEQQLEPFTRDLSEKGFIIDHIQARLGAPSQPALTDIQRRLVDVHT